MGNFHPHGDQAIYDALVRLAQEFAQRYPLVDGQGNFGNIDGDNAAAMRYTEARLTQVAGLLIDGIDEDAVDFRPSYDGTGEEPVVLPAAFPNLLANGSQGIAVGMATSIPPHNAAELCDAALFLIDNPNARSRTLLKYVKGPDFPTGGVIVDSAESIAEAYTTGRGSFRVRARWSKEETGRGTYLIVITEMPWLVQKSRLVGEDCRTPERQEAAAGRRRARRVGRGCAPGHRAARAHGRCRIADGVAVQAHRVGEPHSAQHERAGQGPHPDRARPRRSLARMARPPPGRAGAPLQASAGGDRASLEMLGGFLVAYLNLDKVIKIIRSEDEPKPVLIKTFKLTDVQADAILNMRLRNLRKLEEMEIRAEEKALKEERTKLKSLIGSTDQQWKTIAGQIKELKTTFGPKTELGKRRTTFGEAPEHDEAAIEEAMVVREPITVVVSDKGWIRALRGHVSDMSGVTFKTDDSLKFAFPTETTAKVLIFASNGKFYTLDASKLPGGRGHGEPGAHVFRPGAGRRGWWRPWPIRAAANSWSRAMAATASWCPRTKCSAPRAKASRCSTSRRPTRRWR